MKLLIVLLYWPYEARCRLGTH